MTSYLTPSSAPAELPRTYSIRFVPATPCVDLTPHLVPLDEAQPGDLVGMISGLYVNVHEFPNTERALDSFYVQEENGVEVRFYEDLVGPAADHAAHLVAERIFMGEDLNKMVLRCNMVEDPDHYQVMAVHFADAILYVTAHWIWGEFDPEEQETLNPVVIKMAPASDVEGITDCVNRTRRYLDVFRRMLPKEKLEVQDWSIALPPSSAYLVPGALDAPRYLPDAWA